MGRQAAHLMISVEETLEDELADMRILDVIDDPPTFFSCRDQSRLPEFRQMLGRRRFRTSRHPSEACYVVIAISECPQHRQARDVGQ